ncbi:hypothetical protein Q0P26_14355, partial [Staphylococcus aureus]|nr:hypothetical protein [Staphylococcus aureus]
RDYCDEDPYDGHEEAGLFGPRFPWESATGLCADAAWRFTGKYQGTGDHEGQADTGDEQVAAYAAEHKYADGKS